MQKTWIFKPFYYFFHAFWLDLTWWNMQLSEFCKPCLNHILSSLRRCKKLIRHIQLQEPGFPARAFSVTDSWIFTVSVFSVTHRYHISHALHASSVDCLYFFHWSLFDCKIWVPVHESLWVCHTVVCHNPHIILPQLFHRTQFITECELLHYNHNYDYSFYQYYKHEKNGPKAKYNVYQLLSGIYAWYTCSPIHDTYIWID